MPEDVPLLQPAELELPRAVRWRPIPPLPPAIAIGPDIRFGCSGVRLGEALAIARRGRRVEAPAVAVLLGSDRRLGQLARREGTIGDALASAGFTAVVGPGFSTWWSRSPFESLLNISHTASFAARLSDSLPTIPTVVWRSDVDLRRWADWIGATRATHVAVDLGTLRSSSGWSWAMNGLCVLADATAGSTPHLLVHGPSTVSRLHQLAGLWPAAVTFMSQRPWQLGLHGKRLVADLSDTEDDRPRDVLIERNAETYRKTVAAVAAVAGNARRHEALGGQNKVAG